MPDKTPEDILVELGDMIADALELGVALGAYRKPDAPRGDRVENAWQSMGGAVGSLRRARGWFLEETREAGG